MSATRLSYLAGPLLCALTLVQTPSPVQAQEVQASSAIYVRSDTDHTTVVTPRVHVGSQVTEETRVDVVYSVDVWSSASIDIRTAATPQVTEQRDEIDVALEQALGDATLAASYRYSTEPDYQSHGGSLGVIYDLANKSANVSLTGRAYFDRVGKAGDPDFDRPASTFSGRLSFLQVIDPQMFVQGVYEVIRQEGFLSSPYRRVRIASSADQPPRACRLPVALCLTENNPDSRLRHAFGLSGRRALSEALSIGLGYRFYLDDWDVMSHTATADGALVLDDAWLLSLAYRFYHQGKAVHYQPFYLSSSVPAYRTSDKELTTLSTHRVDVELSRTWAIDDLGSALRLVLLAAPSYFQYHDFPLLDSVSALELTLAVEAQL